MSRRSTRSESCRVRHRSSRSLLKVSRSTRMASRRAQWKRSLHSPGTFSGHSLRRRRAKEDDMAKVRQRSWRVPGQRTKRKAWGYVAVDANGKQVRVFKSDWTKEQAEDELAKYQLGIEEKKPTAAGLTLAQAVDRYLAAKARKRTVAEDKRQCEHLKTAFGADTPLAEVTAARI